MVAAVPVGLRWDDYLNDHEPIGLSRSVSGKRGIYQKVILLDLRKR